MTKRWLLVAMGLGLVGVGLPGATVSAATDPVAEVSWKPCPVYPDGVVRSLGVEVAAFRAAMGRLECGTVRVPLDYADPGGRTIEVAVTRLAATDQAHRLGSVVVLPGGPGGSGYLDPVLRVVLRNGEMAKLNERYDVIGFDPRGVGYSTKVACATGQQGPMQPGPLTETVARKVYDEQVAANQACGNSDPAFLGHLTTETVAKDVDQVRAALGERTVNLLGFSWGTYLGAVYRSLFPTHTGRVFLDSPAPPWTRFDEHIEDSAAAVERDFGRMAVWLARRNATYRLGSTARQVRAEVEKLVRAYDANPKTYSDLPQPIDGSAIAGIAARTSPDWARAGRSLSELRTATGTTAPPGVKDLLGGQQVPPPEGAPELTNRTMNWAVTCNEDSSRPTFDVAWRDYQLLQKRNQATGRMWGTTALCSGWPLPVQQAPLKRTSGSMVLAAHLYESMSVYSWALQLRRTIGGTVYTVADDVHVSTTRLPDCAADVVTYFETGHIAPACPGVQPPD